MEMRADLLIVGAGMVGSALALALQNSGLNILLLDGSPLSVKPFTAQDPFTERSCILALIRICNSDISGLIQTISISNGSS